jgi:hypothetical protein
MVLGVLPNDVFISTSGGVPLFNVRSNSIMYFLLITIPASPSGVPALCVPPPSLVASNPLGVPFAKVV